MSRRELLITFLGVIFITGWGCAPIATSVDLNFDIPFQPEMIAQHTPVRLFVVDKRTDKSLGKMPRGRSEGTSISSTLPVSEVVLTQVTRGLTEAGFVVERVNTPPDTGLIVEINKFNFTTDFAATSSQINTLGEIRAAATKPLRKYAKTYSVENGKKFAFGLPTNAPAEYLNLTLKELIEQLYKDTDLLAFLASQSEPEGPNAN